MDYFITEDVVIRYLGHSARSLTSFPLAMISSISLALCSCTIIPIASGGIRVRRLKRTEADSMLLSTSKTSIFLSGEHISEMLPNMFVEKLVVPAGSKSRARPLLKLSRAHFLVPGALLYTMGATVALLRGFACPLDRMFCGYSIFFFAHLSVSFSNDYHDRNSDRIAGRTLFSGGSGVLLEHRELEKAALRIAQALLLLSFVAALAFTLTYGFSAAFLIFALSGGFLGWFYSAPPLKLSYRGLGEVATALAAGLIMPGMGYFVVSGQLDTWFAVLSVPLIFYGLYFILTVEIPDFEADRAAKKMNIVTRIGVKKASWISLAAALSGTGILAALHFLGFAGGAFDLSKLAIISFLPFATAAASLLGIMTGVLSAERQTAINMFGLVGFLSASVLVLYFELVLG